MNSKDCAIVLSGGITSKGTIPIWVQKRLDVAKKLFDKGKVTAIILSGRGKTEHVESRLMAHYLLEKNIPKKNIVLEDESQNIIEHFLFSQKIMEKNKWRTCIVITSSIQAPQVKAIAKMMFTQPLYATIKTTGQKGMDKEEVKLKKSYEKKLTSFLNKEIFSQITPGDIQAIKDMLYNSKSQLHQQYKTFEAKLNKEYATKFNQKNKV